MRTLQTIVVIFAMAYICTAQQAEFKEHPTLSDTIRTLDDIDTLLAQLEEPALNLDTRVYSFEHAAEMGKGFKQLRALITTVKRLALHGQAPAASELFLIYSQVIDTETSADADVSLYNTDDIDGVKLKTRILKILKPLFAAHQRLFPSVADAVDAVEERARKCAAKANPTSSH
jgi:hypothetical protein